MNSLPPNLESYSTHSYGSLSISLSRIQVHSYDGIQFTPKSFMPEFLGQTPSKDNKASYHPISKSKEYSIVTTLWHFFLYLSDMDFLKIRIIREQAATEQYFCKLPIITKEPSHVLNHNFLNGNLLKSQEKQCDLINKRGQCLGRVTVRIEMQFNEDVHRELYIKEIVDFSEMLVIQGISRIGSMGSSQHLQNVKENTGKQQETIKNLSRKFDDLDHKRHLQTQHETIPTISSSHFQNGLPPRPPHHNNHINYSSLNPAKQKSFQQDEKMLNDDIDRIIAEMQSKPYDSSRYQDQQHQIITHQKNQKVHSFLRSNSCDSHKQSHSPHSHNKIIFKQSKMPPLPSNRTTHSTNALFSHQLSQTHQNFRSSKSKQRDAHPASVSPQMQHSYSSTGFYNQQSSARRIISTNDIEQFKLQTHQLLITGNNSSNSYLHHSSTGTRSNPYHNSHLQKYQLSIFTINAHNQTELISNLIGLPEGSGNSDSIPFHHTSRLKNSSINIEKLKFELRSYQGLYPNSNGKLQNKQILSQGIFEIQKMLGNNKLKGSFMVPIMHRPQHDIRIYESQLQNLESETNSSSKLKIKKVELPIYRTLRIDLEAIESLDRVVQVYINLSNIKASVQNLKVRYKVPYTKDCIQFSKRELEDGSNCHFNIFPHSKKHEALIFQFWNQNQKLVGICQLSLKAMKSVPYQTLIAGMEPIYLYDGKQEISSLTNRSLKVGQFDLVLCYGTVKQVQKMLKKQTFKNERKAKQLVEVQQDRNLGIFVKKRKEASEVSVQVQIQVKATHNHSDQQQDEPMESKLTVKPSIRENNQNRKDQKQKFEDEEDSQNEFKQYKHYSQFRSLKVAQMQQTSLKQPFAVQSKVNKESKQRTQKNQIKEKSKEKRNQIPQIKLISVLETINKLIRSNLIMLADENTLNLLKQKLKPNTLYNFIGVLNFQQILQNFPIMTNGKNNNSQQQFLKRRTVKAIIYEILLPKYFEGLTQSQQKRLKAEDARQQQMINVNILYDLLVSLQLTTEEHPLVKQNLIPEWMIGHHILSILYSNYDFTSFDKNSIDADPLIDNQTEWSEMRGLMRDKGYRITMHQYNAVMQYLKGVQAKNPQFVDERALSIRLRDRIRKQLLEKQFAQETQKIEEQQIVQALYGNQDSSLMRQSQRSAEPSHIDHSFQSTRNQFLDAQEQKHSSPNKQLFSQSHMKQTFMKVTQRERTPQVSRKTHQNTQQNSQAKKVSNKTLSLTVSGLASCQQSASYLFDDIAPEQTFLRILVRSPFTSEVNFKSDSKRLFEIENSYENWEDDFEQLEGEVQLCINQPSLKPVKHLARAVFCLIKEVNSVYALKSADMEFCGIINLTLREQNTSF